MKTHAPVIICTLNRHIHFKRCVESLAACTHAEKTDLFIGLDYPSSNAHLEGYKIIEGYLPTINGFKSVNITKRNKNYGAINNWMSMQGYVFEQYSRIIISEDDNIFSTDFLNFVNKGLEKYKDRDDIFSVSGYGYNLPPPKTYNLDVYSWCGFSAWGVGMWKQKWEAAKLYDEQHVFTVINTFFKQINEIYTFNKIANSRLNKLILMHVEKIVHGDVYYCLYQYINKMYSIFPVISRARNEGHDGSGINCGNSEKNIFKNQRLFFGEINYELPENIYNKSIINEHFSKFFQKSKKHKILLFVKLLLLKIGLLNSKSNKILNNLTK